MTFYLIGSKYDSGMDEVFSIEGSDVTDESAEQTFYHSKDSVFGEKTAKKLSKALDDSKFLPIMGKAKVKILKRIDEYWKENVEGADTHYVNKEKDLVLYEIKL